MKTFNYLNRPLLIVESACAGLINLEWFQDYKNSEILDISEGFATITIHGVLTRRDEGFLNTVSYEEIRNALEKACSNPEVKEILLDIDSPGGEVSGLFELTDFISKCNEHKPIYAYANDMACSAAYAIACSCRGIYVNKTSAVGSVGVIATHADFSKAEEEAGIKYTLVTAGKGKADLSPHIPLSESALSNLQEEVDRLYELFVKKVHQSRLLSCEEIKKIGAKVFYGESAILFGFADFGICGNFRDEYVAFNYCDKNFGGEMNMITENSEEKCEVKEEVEAMKSSENYKAEVLEIIRLCSLAHAEGRILEFIQEDKKAEDVKNLLLSSMSNSAEINNQQTATVAENPLLMAAKKRAFI